MVASPTALREGLLQDLLGRLYGHDLREASVQHLMERLQVDTAQAARVAQWSLAVFDQLQSSLDLRPRQRRLLRWAALLHEVGQFISFSGYQRHGAYILESGELPGFSLQDRHALALLVRLQRGKLKSPPMDGLREHQPRLLACVRILRLSVLLHRRRSPKPLPVPKVRVKGETMTLAFPEGFLEHRAMSRDGLAHERKRQGAAGLSLVFG